MTIADASWIWVIGFRWVHVLSACLLIGATFFFAIAFGKATLASGEPAEPARRFLQMLGRAAIVLLIGTGVYNLLSNRVAYERTLPLSHVLLGLHALLWLMIAALLEMGLSPKRSPTARRRFIRATVILMFVTVALASSLKYVREHPEPTPRPVSAVGQ